MEIVAKRLIGAGLLALTLGLGSATPVLAQDQGVPLPDTIEVAQTGRECENRVVTIYDNDTVLAQFEDFCAPDDQKERQEWAHVPGLYEAARATLEQHGAQVQAALVGETEQCFDYGSDDIRFRPDVAGTDRFSANCPVTELRDLMTALEALTGLVH